MSIDPRKIVCIILDNPSRIRCLTELSQQVGKPPEALRKAFRRSGEGHSLGQLITCTRLTLLAQALLTHPELRCNEVCTQLGFDRLDSAAHAFKHYFGETMREYRRRRLHKP